MMREGKETYTASTSAAAFGVGGAVAGVGRHSLYCS